MDNFYKRVVKAQTEIKAPKNQFNKFGGYKYRSCEDILEAAKPICAANGLLLTVNDEIVLIGERYYVKATATLHDTETDLIVCNTAYARESADKKGMDDSQLTGATSSYARKYALNGLFCLDDTKDADTNEYAQQQKRESIEDVVNKFNDPKKPEEIPSLLCEECNRVILGYKGSNGKNVTPEQHVAFTQKNFGKNLCLECAKKAKSDAKRDKATEG